MKSQDSVHNLTTTFSEEKGQPKRYRTEVLPLIGQTGSRLIRDGKYYLMFLTMRRCYFTGMVLCDYGISQQITK